VKILFFSDNFYPETNAAAYRVYERACLWVKAGHEVTVITSCPNFPEGKPFAGYKNKWRFVEDVNGIRVVRVKTFMTANRGVCRRMMDFVSFMFSSFFFSLFEKKPDIVVASSPQFFSAPAGYMTSVFKRVPFALEIADLWPESVRAVGAMGENRLLDLMEKVELFLYRRANIIITLTQSIKLNIQKRGIPQEKIKTITNGVNLEFFKTIEKKDSQLLNQLELQDQFVVGYLGTLGMAHDLESVLKTAQLLSSTQSNIHFLIVGAGADKENLNKMKTDLDLKNVTLIDRQSKEEIKRYWSLCDLALVHLKNIDTFSTVIPSKIFEAMAMAKPILYCGPQSDGSQIVTQENVGLQINSGDPVLLKTTLLDIEKQKSLLSTMSLRGPIAVKNYTRQHQAEKFIETIDAYLNNEVEFNEVVSREVQ